MRAAALHMAAAVTLLPTWAQGQPYDPQDWSDPVVLVRYAQDDVSIEAGIHDGRVVVTRDQGRSVIHTTLTGQRLRDLRLHFLQAEPSPDQPPLRSALTFTYEEDDETLGVDAGLPQAQALLQDLRWLSDTLLGLVEPQPTVALARQGQPGQGYASIAFDGDQLLLLYTLEGQVHVLRGYALTPGERSLLRQGWARVVSERSPVAHVSPVGGDGEPWLLELHGASAVHSYRVEGLSALPPAAWGIAAELRARLDALRVVETTQVGLVLGDQILCAGVTLRARQPLAGLLERVHGQRVVVQAAFESGSKVGAALYLVARVGDRILPVAGSGVGEDEVLAMRAPVRPSGLRVPSAQTRRRSWKLDQLALTWTDLEVLRLIGRPAQEPATPVDGRVEEWIGALPR